MKVTLFLAGFCVVLLDSVAGLGASVSLFSGDEKGEHPAPMIVGKVKRDERFRIEVVNAVAYVNYADPKNAVIVSRIVTAETGGIVTCSRSLVLDGTPSGIWREKTEKITVNHKVFCEMPDCDKNPAALLFGRYDVSKCIGSDGKDFGFGYKEIYNDKILSICCQEFTVERIFKESHYFDWLLIVDGSRAQPISDLDIEYKNFYLTFENENGERTTCSLTDLVDGMDNWIRVADQGDCTLPPGDRFTMYAQSRFYLKETKPCGKLVAKGVKGEEGEYYPDWFMAMYECEGRKSRQPIEKQYTYSTAVELEFISADISG